MKFKKIHSYSMLQRALKVKHTTKYEMLASKVVHACMHTHPRGKINQFVCGVTEIHIMWLLSYSPWIKTRPSHQSAERRNSCECRGREGGELLPNSLWASKHVCTFYQITAFAQYNFWLIEQWEAKSLQPQKHPAAPAATKLVCLACSADLY